MGRGLEDVDEVVMGVITERLSRPDAASLFSEDVDLDALRSRAVELRGRRDGLASMLADGLLGPEAVRTQAARLSAELDDVERAMADATGASPMAAVLSSSDVSSALERLPVRDLRAVIDALALVRIMPAGRAFASTPNRSRSSGGGRSVSDLKLWMEESSALR